MHEYLSVDIIRYQETKGLQRAKPKEECELRENDNVQIGPSQTFRVLVKSMYDVGISIQYGMPDICFRCEVAVVLS